MVNKLSNSGLAYILDSLKIVFLYIAKLKKLWASLVLIIRQRFVMSESDTYYHCVFFLNAFFFLFIKSVIRDHLNSLPGTERKAFYD